MKKYFLKSSSLVNTSFSNIIIIEMIKKMSKKIKFKIDLVFFGRMFLIISFLKSKIITRLVIISIPVIKD